VLQCCVCHCGPQVVTGNASLTRLESWVRTSFADVPSGPPRSVTIRATRRTQNFSVLHAASHVAQLAVAAASLLHGSSASDRKPFLFQGYTLEPRTQLRAARCTVARLMYCTASRVLHCCAQAGGHADEHVSV
jgi:hypothetical protein